VQQLLDLGSAEAAKSKNGPMRAVSATNYVKTTSGVSPGANGSGDGRATSRANPSANDGDASANPSANAEPFERQFRQKRLGSAPLTERPARPELKCPGMLP
jgi:hypothetical protein